MVKRNVHCCKFGGRYLFPEVKKRADRFLQEVPKADLISLGIGDTTLPIPTPVCQAMQDAAAALGTHDGYRGYGPSEGEYALRERVARIIYEGRVSPDEVFISDGAKCDISRLQILFGPHVRIGVQDPTYPVYVDGSVAVGVTGPFSQDARRYEEVFYLPCHAENGFFPSIADIPELDVLYLCSPNNPTGAVASYSQLEAIVTLAKQRGMILVLDTAYAQYIQGSEFPRSAYSCSGAREVAIETGSFSKMAGFTGIRLGWTVVPKEVMWDDGTPLHADWQRISTTLFNGASNIAQAGGIAVLDALHTDLMEANIRYYLENARKLRALFLAKGRAVYGGEHAPFLWVAFPERGSWESFQWLLEGAHVVTTPGIGFGPGGEGYLRFSAFGQAEKIAKAVERLDHLL